MISPEARRSIVVHASSVAAVGSFFLLALGSGGTKTDSGEGGSTSASPALGESKVSVCGKALPNYEYIRATCLKKAEGTCDELYGLIPKFTPTDCPKEGGVFGLSGTSCPKEGLLGTCHYPQSKAGEPGQFASYYANGKTTAAAAKADCLDQHGGGQPKEWIDGPPAPVASVAPAASSAKPGAKPTTPAAKPSAKPKTK
jgi:hypothetical protein